MPEPIEPNQNMKMLKSIGLTAILAVVCMELLSGCSTNYGNYKTVTVAGGVYKRISTGGNNETMQINLLWIPVYKQTPQ